MVRRSDASEKRELAFGVRQCIRAFVEPASVARIELRRNPGLSSPHGEPFPGSQKLDSGGSQPHTNLGRVPPLRNETRQWGVRNRCLDSFRRNREQKK